MDCCMIFWVACCWNVFFSNGVTASDLRTNLTSNNGRNCLDAVVVHINPVVLQSIIESNTKFTSNDSLITNETFLERFPRFLLTFNLTAENETTLTNMTPILGTVADYNFQQHHRGTVRFQPLQLWISILPAKNVSLAMHNILQVISTANSKFPGTVSTLFYNYQYLQLTEESASAVHHDIKTVADLISKSNTKSLISGLMLDRHNCQGKDNYLRSLDLTTETEVIFTSVVTPDEDIRFHMFSIASCFPLQKIMKAKPSVVVTESFTISFLSATYTFKFPVSDEVLKEYSRLTASRYNGSLVFPAKSVHTVTPVKSNHNYKPKLDETWLNTPADFNKNHIGVSIYSNYENDSLEQLFNVFRKVVVESRMGNNNRLEALVTNVAHYKTNILRQENKLFQDGIPVELTVVVNLYSGNSSGDEKSIMDAFHVAKAANEIYPGIVGTLLLSWGNCFENETVCVKTSKEDVMEDANKMDLFRERLFKLFSLLFYAMKVKKRLLQEQKKAPIVGIFWEHKFCRELMDFIRLWDNNGQLGSWLDQADIFVFKVLLQKRDILAFGAEKVGYLMIQDVTNCEQNMEFRFPSKLKSTAKMSIFIKLTGCSANHSDITELAEIARFWELMNIWAVKENRTVIMDAAYENQGYVSTNSPDMACDLNTAYLPSGQCDCGWWIATGNDSNELMSYQDRKSMALKLYRQQNLLFSPTTPSSSTNDSGLKDNTNLILMATFIPVIVVVIIVSILTSFLVLRYRSKYRLSRQEIKNFLQGSHKSASNRCEDEEGCENAESAPYNKDRYEVSPSSFKMDSKRSLGSGEFAVICVGFMKRDKDQVEVAVKTTKKRGIGNGNTHGDLMAFKALISEIKILSYIGEHPHIVRLEGAYTANLRVGKVFLFLELCQGGSLAKYLRTIKPEEIVNTMDRYEENVPNEQSISRKEKLSKDLFRWAFEIASGMEFLVSKKLVHADIATRNILLDSDMCAKISDFGLSRLLYNYRSYVKEGQEPLPWRWMAPESLRRLIFNEKTDVWAFGVTLWEMYTLGDEPYAGLSWDVNFPVMLDRGLRLQIPNFNDHNSQIVYPIMMKCWKAEPDNRPTFTELKTVLRTLAN